MKRLILDHFRRWRWILAVAASLAFVLGWCMAAPAGFFEHTHGRAFNLVFLQFKVESMMYEFSTLDLALLTGAFLLLFDLHRGMMSAVVPLPLTAGQIGRSWWLALVAIPAVALVGLLLAGAETFHYFHPGQPFPWERLVTASLFTLLWPGIMFIGILGPRAGFAGSGGQRARSLLYSLLASAMMFFGISFYQQESKRPFRFAIFLGVGACLTLVGWLRAGQFNPVSSGSKQRIPKQLSRSRTKLALTPLEPRLPVARQDAPSDPGGIPFLIRTCFLYGFLQIAGVVVPMALVFLWLGKRIWQPHLVAIGVFVAWWFSILDRLMPVLQHLRCLRTLPISATRLAAVLVAIAVLPLLALSVLLTAAAGLTLGTSTALSVFKPCIVILAAATLCPFFAIWRRGGIQAYALMLLTLFAFLWTFFHFGNISLVLTVLILALGVLLAVGLTRLSLARGACAFRVGADPRGTLRWGIERQS